MDLIKIKKGRVSSASISKFYIKGKKLLLLRDFELTETLVELLEKEGPFF